MLKSLDVLQSLAVTSVEINSNNMVHIVGAEGTIANWCSLLRGRAETKKGSQRSAVIPFDC